MSKTNRGKKKGALQKDRYNSWVLSPLLVILSIIPTIVLMKVVPLKGVSAEIWISKDSVDFFNYYKSTIFTFLSAILLLTFLIKVKNSGLEIKKSIYYYPLAVYAVFIIISLFTAKYYDVALYGFVERYEGSLVLLSYIVVAFAAMNLAVTEKQIKLLTAGVLISAAVISLIGLLQFIGWDFYKSFFGRNVIVPSQYAQIREQLNFTFPKHQVYTSLYNPNYIGSYSVLILPVLLGLMLYFRNIYLKVGMFLFFCAALLSLIGSGSKTGMGITALITVILLILLRKLIIKDIKIILIAFVVLIVAAVGANQITNGFLYDRISSVGNSIKQSLEIAKVPEKMEDRLKPQQITTGTDAMSIKTNKVILNLKLSNNQIQFLDQNNSLLEITYGENNLITFNNPQYKDIKAEIKSDGTNSNIFVGEYTIPFFVTESGFKMQGVQGKLEDPVNPPILGFKDKETLASGRGYIWSRTIPMLKNTIFKGYGADTYAVHFPQNDFAGKLVGLGSTNIVVDKPHNMYLQMGVNTGVISVIAFIFLVIAYFISSTRLYFATNPDTLTKLLGSCIFVSILGYCLAGIFNDSTVSVAPVFWAMLGMGIAINHTLKNVTLKEK
ncbi:MAG: O-antigen ligase family protein [Clostridia bacterium]|nr:O-antigen ligase family protein [Clostridia bacterium]